MIRVHANGVLARSPGLPQRGYPGELNKKQIGTYDRRPNPNGVVASRG
jgi:hypothetical protein